MFGCATSHPKFDVAALKPYQKLMLVPVKTDEMLFVTQRNQDIGRSGNMSLFSLLEEVRINRDRQLNQDFNKLIKRDMKPELEAKLYAQINKNFTVNQIKYTTFEVSASEIVMKRYWGSDEVKTSYLKLLREKCPACDAALLIDPSFGFVQKGNAGWRASSTVDLLLLNLVDGTIRAKSSASFVDETSKYDFPTDVDVLKKTPDAEQYILPTVEGLAKVMLTSFGLVSR